MRKVALSCARGKWIGGAVSFALRHFSRILPIKRVYEDARLLAFFHRSPSYQPHVLIVPKARVRTVLDLCDEDFCHVARVAEHIIEEFDWKLSLYQLRINGGIRQDVMQAHFHLIPASSASGVRIGGPHGIQARLSEMVHNQNLQAHGFSVILLIDGRTGKTHGDVWMMQC